MVWKIEDKNISAECLKPELWTHLQEILDLYDTYMDQAEEKRKAACVGQLSFEDILGGDSSAG